MLSIIVAIDRNNAIGIGNKLIYWLPDDLRRFKQLTTGNTIIMGRKTFESLPKGALPNRRNIVLSRNKNVSFSGADVFPSFKEALDDCRRKAEEMPRKFSSLAAHPSIVRHSSLPTVFASQKLMLPPTTLIPSFPNSTVQNGWRPSANPILPTTVIPIHSPSSTSNAENSSPVPKSNIL